MKPTRRLIWILGFAVLAATALPASADRDRHEGHWRGGDIRHFERHDLPVWRGGYWHHGRHDGRLGWWWIVGGLWYFYPAPVYPYPDPYIPPVVVTPAPAPAPAAPTAQVWYYCDAARGYYPYVPSCPGGWRTVPAVPPQ